MGTQMGLFWETDACPSLPRDVCGTGLQSLLLSITATTHGKTLEPNCPRDKLTLDLLVVIILGIPCVFFFSLYLFCVFTNLCLALAHMLSSLSCV